MQFIMRCAFVGCLGIGWYDVKNQRVLHEVFAGTSFLLAVIHSVLFTHIEYNQMVKDIRQENQTFFVMFYQKTRAKVFERLLQGPYYLKFLSWLCVVWIIFLSISIYLFATSNWWNFRRFYGPLLEWVLIALLLLQQYANMLFMKHYDQKISEVLGNILLKKNLIIKEE